MFLEDYNCVHCVSAPVEETVLHLFFSCPFAQIYWASLGLLPPQSVDPFVVITTYRTQLHCPFALEILITMCWSIWSVRNDLIFRGIQPSLNRSKTIFKKEFAQVILRAKPSYEPYISQWLEGFV
jgi:hypothetical protein